MLIRSLFASAASRVPVAASTVALAAALVSFIAAPARAQTCYTPLEWQPKLGSGWVNDLNNNNVDDWIEHLAPSDTLNLLLALNDCPSSQDLARFASVGRVRYRSPYLSVVALQRVSAANAVALGNDVRVAEVFPDLVVRAYLDTSVATMRVRPSAAYSPQTVWDAMPQLSGNGLNIAIMDSGVNDQTHESLQGKYVAGYDFFNNVAGNPIDEKGHGTHVAGIALGTGGPNPFRAGVAPGAGLVDLRVLGPDGKGPGWAILRAADTCITKREDWNIRVLNASLGVDEYPDGSPFQSNGLDPMSQLFNRVAAAGIVPVVAAGNSGMALIGTPAAAADAITVAASTDQATVNRADNQLASFSSRGPRVHRATDPPAAWQKPDVAAPGTNFDPNLGLPDAETGILSADFAAPHGYIREAGTSMAAPHVAGLAALLIDLKHELTVREVKQAILGTADRHGAGWDPGWGWGEANGYASLNALVTNAADVGFAMPCHSDPVWWESPDIVPVNPKIVAGVPNTIRCTVHNYGPVPAYKVQVKLGVYNFGNDMAAYDLSTITIAGPLDAGSDTVVTCDWTPKYSGPAPGTMHACLKAEVVYAPDTYEFNNCAQHNVEVLQAAQVAMTTGGASVMAATTGDRAAEPFATTSFSPVTTVMQVTNPTHEWLSIDVRRASDDLAGSGWTFQQSTFGVGLYPGDCPANVTLTLTPGPGARSTVHVAMSCRGFSPNGPNYELGGASITGQIDATAGVGQPGTAAELRLSVSPNPSRGPASIVLSLSARGPADVAIYDLIGRRVKTLFRGDAATGEHTLVWAGDDDRGRRVASGTYWARAIHGGRVTTKSVLRIQ